MADQQVKIVVSAEDKASAELKKVNKELGGIGSEAKTTNQKFTDNMKSMATTAGLVAAGVVGVAASLKKVYEAGREGAELEFTIAKFDRLSESINTTSKALIDDLKKATDGTMSDMELMTTATDFMTLGLAKSKEEVVRLSTVASQLGMNMNQLVLTLTNRTTMRFDALGVAVDGFDEKVKALEKSGLSAEDAFTEAFLQQAEEQIAKVGSVTDETIGTFMRFEAAIEDLNATMKMKLAPTVAEVVNVLTQGINVLSGDSGWANLLDDVNDQVRKGTMTYDEYKFAVNKVIRETGLLVDINGELFAHTADGILKLKGARNEIELLSEAEVEAAKYTAGWTEENYKAYHGIHDLDEALEEYTETVNYANQITKKFSDTMLYQAAVANLDSKEAILALGVALGVVDQATVYATDKMDAYTIMLQTGQITLETYNALVAGLANALRGMPDDVNVDLWLNMHGYDEFQRVYNAIGSGGGSSQFGGVTPGSPIAQAAGGPVRPGQTVVVGESGPEILQMGQNGGHIYPTNVTNNFNLGVTTLQNANSIQTAFAIMQAMA